MSRKLERKLMLIGSIWNFITATITILAYSTWFRNAGISKIKSDSENLRLNSQLLDNVTSMIMVFGLFILVGGIFNLYIMKRVKDGEIQKKVMVWLIFWGLINLISSDPIGFGIYLITFIFYLSRNKAIKVVNSTN